MGIFFSTWKNRTLQVDQICRKFWKLLHFLTEFSITSADSLQLYALQPVWLLSSWNSPGKNTGVGCHFLLQGIFLTQGLNLGLPHQRQMLYHLSHREAQYLYRFINKQNLLAICTIWVNLTIMLSKITQNRKKEHEVIFIKFQM